MKRVVHVYEVLDESGATISFEPTMDAARRMVRASEPGARLQRIAVPTATPDLCKFLTEKAGGAS